MLENIILLANSIKTDPGVSIFESDLCESLIVSIKQQSVFARTYGDMLVAALPDHKLTPELMHQITQL